MKTILILALIASSAAALDNPLHELLNVPGPVGDVAREKLKYPPISGESPAETEARVSLLKWKDQSIAAKIWTPALELEFQRMNVELARQKAERVAAEAAAAAARQQPPTVIIIKK